MKTTKTIELSYSEIANLIGPIVKERVGDIVKVISIQTCRPSITSLMALQQAQYPPMDLEETLKIEIEVVK